MLAARHRMRAADEFGAAIRFGARSGTRRITVHYRTGSTLAPEARVGFIVSKAVGNSVVRNKVKRRLRSVMVEELDRLPDATAVVVRALPAAAAANFGELAADLRRALDKARRKVTA